MIEVRFGMCVCCERRGSASLFSRGRVFIAAFVELRGDAFFLRCSSPAMTSVYWFGGFLFLYSSFALISSVRGRIACDEMNWNEWKIIVSSDKSVHLRYILHFVQILHLVYDVSVEDIPTCIGT